MAPVLAPAQMYYCCRYEGAMRERHTLVDIRPKSRRRYCASSAAAAHANIYFATYDTPYAIAMRLCCHAMLRYACRLFVAAKMSLSLLLISGYASMFSPAIEFRACRRYDAAAATRRCCLRRAVLRRRYAIVAVSAMLLQRYAYAFIRHVDAALHASQLRRRYIAADYRCQMKAII